VSVSYVSNKHPQFTLLTNLDKSVGPPCLHLVLFTRSLSSEMAPRKFKESGDIFEWVNTSKTNRPNFKLVEQDLTTNQAGHTQIPKPSAPVSQPVIKEPGGNENVQLPLEDMHLFGDVNNLEFPAKKRKVTLIEGIGLY